jgi:hypothetical protein
MHENTCLLFNAYIMTMTVNVSGELLSVICLKTHETTEYTSIDRSSPARELVLHTGVAFWALPPSMASFILGAGQL